MNTNEACLSNDSILNKRRFVTIGIGIKLGLMSATKY